MTDQNYREIVLTLHPDDYELVEELADRAGISVDAAVSRIFRGMLKTSIRLEKIMLAKEQGQNTQH